MGKPARQHGMLSAAHPAARDREHSGTRQPRVSGLLHRVQKCFYSFPANFLVFPAFVSCSVFCLYFWNGTQKLCCNHLIFAWIFGLPFFFSLLLFVSHKSAYWKVVSEVSQSIQINTQLAIKLPNPWICNTQYFLFQFPCSMGWE